MLEATGLDCERGGRTLFRRLGLSINKGDLVRVSGANGSGKTSLLRILCGLLAPGAGEVRWKGTPIGALREEYSRQLVYLGHAPAIKDDLTAAENLGITCALAGNAHSGSEIESALEGFGVPSAVQLKKLSQGQRRRAALARLSVSKEIPLWLLDEPFASLDKAALKLTEELIERQVANGGSVVYTAHLDDSLRAGRVVELG